MRKFRQFTCRQYGFNLFARWHQQLWFKTCGDFQGRCRQLKVVKSCSCIVTSHSIVQTLLLKDVSFSHNTLHHRQTDRQTAVSCQYPIILCAAVPYDRLTMIKSMSCIHTCIRFLLLQLHKQFTNKLLNSSFQQLPLLT